MTLSQYRGAPPALLLAKLGPGVSLRDDAGVLSARFDRESLLLG